MSTIITKRQFPGYHKYEMELAGRPLTMEVGKLAELANAAVMVGYGEFSKLADLKREGTASELHLVLVVVGELSVGDDGRHLSISFFVKFRMGADRLALEKTSARRRFFNC